MSARPTRIGVAVATLGRPAEVAALLARLARQTRAPDLVVLCAPDASHLPALDAGSPTVRLYGPPDLCAQRNRALEAMLDRVDVIVFLDDDFLPADDYLAEALAAFQQNPDWRVAMGDVLLDGARGAPIDPSRAEAALRARSANRPAEWTRRHPGAYGCNMCVRVEAIGDHRFDERLALYGWQEDIDFTNRVARGCVIQTSRLAGVHLGARGARVSGRRLGYSQIANPVYLMRKGSMPVGFALRLMLRNAAANALRSLRPEPWIDRRGRLAGNVIAAWDVARGRFRPERIRSL